MIVCTGWQKALHCMLKKGKELGCEWLDSIHSTEQAAGHRAEQHSTDCTAWHSAAWHSAAWHSAAWHSAAQHVAAQHSTDSTA